MQAAAMIHVEHLDRVIAVAGAPRARVSRTEADRSDDLEAAMGRRRSGYDAARRDAWASARDAARVCRETWHRGTSRPARRRCSGAVRSPGRTATSYV